MTTPSTHWEPTPSLVHRPLMMIVSTIMMVKASSHFATVIAATVVTSHGLEAD